MSRYSPEQHSGRNGHERSRSERAKRPIRGFLERNPGSEIHQIQTILVDGLTHHSEAIFPSLPVKEGDRVLDIGCGFGDTAIKLARRVGQSGKVVGLDCCEAFLEYGRKDAASLVL